MYLTIYNKNIPLTDLAQENIIYEEQDFSVNFNLQSSINDIGVKVEDLYEGLKQHFKGLMEQYHITNSKENVLKEMIDTLTLLENQYKTYQSL